MNLTQPPPVRRPHQDRVDAFRTALLDAARDDARRNDGSETGSKHRRRLLPVLAATVTTAAVAAAAVALPRLSPLDTRPGRSTTATATSPAPSTPTAKAVAMAPAPPTRPGPPAVRTDLGPATMAEVRTMVRSCVARQDTKMMFGPIDARTATIEWGRWIAVPRIGSPDDARRSRQPGRALVASVVDRDRKYRVLCYDGVSLTGEDLRQPDDVRLVLPDRRYPINGGCSPRNERRGGRWLIEALCTYTVVDQARVDMRLVWNGGAGAWHTAVGGRGFSLVDLVATGTGAKRSNPRLDVRVIDRDGSVFYRTIGSIEVPIASVHG